MVESYVRMLLGRNNWRIHGLSLYMPSEPGGEDLVSTNQMGYMARMLHFAARISIPGAAEALRWMGRQFFRHMIVVQPDRPVRLSATIGGGSSFPSLSSGDGCGLLFGLPSSWAISYHDSYASQKAGRSHQEPLTSRHFETTWIGMLYHEAHGMWVHYKALDRFAPFLG